MTVGGGPSRTQWIPSFILVYLCLSLWSTFSKLFCWLSVWRPACFLFWLASLNIPVENYIKYHICVHFSLLSSATPDFSTALCLPTCMDTGIFRADLYLDFPDSKINPFYFWCLLFQNCSPSIELLSGKTSVSALIPHISFFPQSARSPSAFTLSLWLLWTAEMQPTCILNPLASSFIL